ncbi:TadE/TadG family type IV pilus assembly protein [Aureimonas sp. AU4]|uniref:TadE/TadG family type IV pilus assembly protein n=1 Tax=Aureimonas sp. AU4 TaxID=1638163 RepID=UPI0009E9B1B5|nr:TadE/TadG family type IV pilus assembly protein [Aureimonas sp. AU4]
MQTTTSRLGLATDAARRWSRIARYFNRSSDGVAAVEFALLGAPFFLIIFMILETACIFIGDITLEQATARAGRTVRTGQVATLNQSEADFRKNLCGNILVLLNCDNVRIDLRSYSSFSSIPTDAPIASGRLQSGEFQFERGNPGQIMALRVFYEYPLYTDIVDRFLSDLDDNKHLLMSVAVFQTEPF